MTQILVDSCTQLRMLKQDSDDSLDGTRISSAKAGAQSLKNEWPRNTLVFSLHQLPVPALRSFQPSSLYIRVGGRIKLGKQSAKQLKLFLAAEGTDVLLDFFDCLSHDATPLNLCCVRVYP